MVFDASLEVLGCLRRFSCVRGLEVTLVSGLG